VTAGGDADIRGFVKSGFEPVRDAFQAVVRNRPGFGAALCVYLRSEPCVDVWGGPTYAHDSLQLVFSATKGAVAVCANMLSQRGVLDLDATVASVWPEFASGGKEAVRVRWLLSHQAGLPTVGRKLTLQDLIEGQVVIDALACQVPYWTPGAAHGYHALTIGYLVGEVIRRATGKTLGQFFADEVAGPLGLDFWIGLPVELEGRVVPVRMNGRSMTNRGSAAAALTDVTSLPSRVTSNPTLNPLDWNLPAVHRTEIPAANGICSARSLARMYAACIGPVDGVRLLSDETLSRACTVQAEGVDLVNREENRFGLGFYLPFARIPFAGPSSFGHDGLGGALGFADRETGIAFGFVTDLVPELAGVDPATRELIAAARQCISGTALAT